MFNSYGVNYFCEESKRKFFLKFDFEIRRVFKIDTIFVSGGLFDFEIG